MTSAWETYSRLDVLPERKSFLHIFTCSLGRGEDQIGVSLVSKFIHINGVLSAWQQLIEIHRSSCTWKICKQNFTKTSETLFVFIQYTTESPRGLKSATTF